jgi:DNA-directed RNA polymerase specialized sigma54-like protein
VCRADLAQVIDPQVAIQFTDDDMLTLADKMADAYTDSGLFWISLEIIAENILERKARQEADGLA